jgi:hypothetical protein
VHRKCEIYRQLSPKVRIPYQTRQRKTWVVLNPREKRGEPHIFLSYSDRGDLIVVYARYDETQPPAIKPERN